MSAKKYCQECGLPSANLSAKFCGSCGHPFDGNVARATVPAPEPRTRRTKVPTRRAAEVEEGDEGEDEEGDDSTDASYVPAIDGLEVDIQVTSNREQIKNIANTHRCDFERPKDETPKTQEQFLAEWKKEAGTARNKK